MFFYAVPNEDFLEKGTGIYEALNNVSIQFLISIIQLELKYYLKTFLVTLKITSQRLGTI
jgi:hypothetical protein